MVDPSGPRAPPTYASLAAQLPPACRILAVAAPKLPPDRALLAAIKQTATQLVALRTQALFSVGMPQCNYLRTEMQRSIDRYARSFELHCLVRSTT